MKTSEEIVKEIESMQNIEFIKYFYYYRNDQGDLVKHGYCKRQLKSLLDWILENDKKEENE